MIVTVDGAEIEVGAETTVKSLRDGDVFKAAAGDLIGIRGGIVRPSGGARVRVLRNGAPAEDWQRLYRGDVLVSRAGENRVESIEVTEVPIPFGTTVKGKGPVADVTREGVAGVRRVTRGAVSLVEIASEVVSEPRDELLVRRSPKPGAKLVALTFDDGPWPEWTEAVLDVLAERDVRATFFVLGRQVKRHPGLTERIAEDGHLLGSHSLSHKRYSELKASQIRRETTGSWQAIRDASGVSTEWIRPPYGSMDAKAWRELRRLKAQVVMWDVDPKDWQRPGSAKIASRVVRHVKPGSIVLLHDGGGNRKQTLRALPRIIKRLRAKGYMFVTVEELVEADGVSKAPTAAALASYQPKNP